MKGIALRSKVNCDSEYSSLKKVLVVKPSFMRITKVINETQKHYMEDNINIPLALEQHGEFVRMLRSHGIQVLQLPEKRDLHEQVFTRDIGFTIHDRLFVSSMSEQVRRSETEVLKTWLEESFIPYEEVSDSIEGGDVVIDGSTIWVGNSGRTSKQAIKNLQHQLPSCDVVPLALKEDILHLDCVFNILDKDTALVYPPAFTQQGLRKIKSNFEIVPVTKKEQFYMGPNVLSIGQRKVISLRQNKRLNKLLEEKGFHIIPVDFSEIIKSGGSFRCCSLPLVRE
ncbi:dimethylarginine dimethylaminohydrolase family protein [Virgibacillus kekensis]|uniref:Dimethylarginine dimethylaminohydrolase family protein n=1 Tax=Virgibacillus kekensis TaxID=202261 RepID=A0ABV9DEU1_9BACI